jgi:rubrerythrin
MEAGQKKLIMVAIIAVCIAAAVIITLATRTGPAGGIESLKHGEMIWLKCRDCENTWQMDKKDYLEYIEKYRVGMQAPGVECPKCHKKSGYRAIKCEHCGYIFEKPVNTRDFPDRCPKCGYSAREEAIKKNRGEK